MDGEHTELDVIVRNLTRDDCKRLVRIDEQITGRKRLAWYQGKIDRALEDSAVQISLGAEHDGMLVGALLGSVQYGEFGLPEPMAVLDTVLVDRELGNRGIATALFEQLARNLGALRIERIRTEVSWAEQELLGFFRKQGFAPVPRLVLEVDLTGGQG